MFMQCFNMGFNTGCAASHTGFMAVNKPFMVLRQQLMSFHLLRVAVISVTLNRQFIVRSLLFAGDVWYYRTWLNVRYLLV